MANISNRLTKRSKSRQPTEIEVSYLQRFQRDASKITLLTIKASSAHSQQGVVLIISLIMLLLLTLIGMGGTQITGLQEKMAGNLKDRNLAFQAAESALKMGEMSILTLPYNCTNGRYKEMDKDCNEIKETTTIWENINWSGQGDPLQSVEYTYGALAGLSANPRFIIEYLGCAPTPCNGLSGTVKYSFRVTSRATGGTESAVVMLQSIVETTNPPSN